MDKKQEKKVKLFLALQLLFWAVGIALLGVSLFGKSDSSWPLIGALFCIAVSNFASVFRNLSGRKKK